MGISFSNVPEDSSCTVIFEQEMALGNMAVLYRKWHGEGVTGDDFFIHAADAASMDESSLKDIVRSSALVGADSPIIISRTGDFLCARFNVHRI